MTGIDIENEAGDPTWCPVEGFLNKPVKPDILLAEVEKLLSERPQMEPLQAFVRV
jgi:hypothetical protein